MRRTAGSRWLRGRRGRGHVAPQLGRGRAFSARQIEHYQLEPFLAELPPEAMAVGERDMVAAHLRGGPLFRELRLVSRSFVSEKHIQLIFGACEPHLLSLYLGQGSRPYAKHNINSPEAGYLIPIVTVVEDVEYLRRIGSPNAETAVDFGDDARIPDCVDRLVPRAGNVLSQRLAEAGANWGEIHRALGELGDGHFSALDGLSDEEAERCLGRSSIIERRAGDRVLKKGGVARNMFVVLDGRSGSGTPWNSKRMGRSSRNASSRSSRRPAIFSRSARSESWSVIP